MKKIFVYLIIFVILLQLVFAQNGDKQIIGSESQQQEKPVEFDVNDHKTWEKSNDWEQINSQQLSNAHPSIVEKATDIQAKTYFNNKIPPTRELNTNEWILIRKIYPNLDSSLGTVEGVKLGEGVLETPNGKVNFAQHKTVDVRYTKDGLKVGDIILIQGGVDVDSRGNIILDDNSHFKFKSITDEFVDTTVTKKTMFGSCDNKISCMVEVKDKRVKNLILSTGQEQNVWFDTNELRIISLEKNQIEIKTKDGTYDNININNIDDGLFKKNKDNFGWTKVSLIKDDDSTALLEYPTDGKPIVKNIGNLKTDFHDKFIDSKEQVHNFDLVSVEDYRISLIDNEGFGSWTDYRTKFIAGAENNQVFIFGENHWFQYDDALFTSLLPELKERGYKDIGFELRSIYQAEIDKFVRGEIDINQMKSSILEKSNEGLYIDDISVVIEASKKLGLNIHAFDEKYPNQPPLTLKDVKDFAKFDEMIKKRLEFDRTHPRDPLMYENLKMRVFNDRPDAKVVIFVGDHHAMKNFNTLKDPPWEGKNNLFSYLDEGTKDKVYYASPLHSISSEEERRLKYYWKYGRHDPYPIEKDFETTIRYYTPEGEVIDVGKPKR